MRLNHPHIGVRDDHGPPLPSDSQTSAKASSRERSWNGSSPWGDAVVEDDPLLSVMTDKATVEIPSPVSGTVTALTGGPGDIIAVGEICAEFEIEGEGAPTPETSRTAEPEAEPR